VEARYLSRAYHVCGKRLHSSGSAIPAQLPPKSKNSLFPANLLRGCATSAYQILAFTLLLAVDILPAAAETALSTTEAPLESVAFVEDLEHRTFNFFWEAANPANGLVPDRYPAPSFASISAVGFALTGYPIGVERGYITRAAARDRVLATLRFFRDAPQGTAAKGVTGYKGFYYHFLDMNTGMRYSPRTELSLIDTSLLIAGVLFCESYVDGRDPAYRRVDWEWASRDDGEIAWPRAGRVQRRVAGNPSRGSVTKRHRLRLAQRVG
jgi:hypothetical protein